jgi:spoIIIJ-associated protein
MSNNDSIEVSASSVEEATAQALEQLGAAQDDVVIEILANPRSGVLGLGAREARVRVSRRADGGAATSGVTAPPPAPPPPRREAPRQQQPRSEGRPERPQPQRPQPPQNQSRDRQDARANEGASDNEARDVGIDDDRDSDAARHGANADEQVREASGILAQILELMNEKSEIRRGAGDPETLEIEIKGDGSGILIGRHGQTLDALEYILNRIVAHRIKDAIPIMLDTEAYRARRREQLHRMALSMGERAKREHISLKLDPMPPRDRRIVHLALKDDPLVTTRSAGEGFLRMIEIVPSQARREKSGNRDDNRGNRDRDRNRGNEQQQQRPRERQREPERPREQERPRESEHSSIGEQGGFKHGQKRLF